MFRLSTTRSLISPWLSSSGLTRNLSTTGFVLAARKTKTQTTAKNAEPPTKKKRKVAPQFRQQMSERAKASTHAFQAPYIIKEPLASIINQTELSRPQIVKHVWEYIKLHGVQDPNNKRVYKADANLANLFGPEFTIFDVSKHLSKFIQRK